MNYYRPRELKGPDGDPSGRWHYTVMHDGLVRPVGYCAHACHGHPTREDAREHYRAYLLDTAFYGERLQEQQQRCAVCDAWTDRLARAGSLDYHVLCDEHCNRAGLAQVLEVDDSISSY